MALVVLGATRSSPGVTTAALALGAVWPRGDRHAARGRGRSRRWCPRRTVRAGRPPQPDRAGRSHPVRLAADRRVGPRAGAALAVSVSWSPIRRPTRPTPPCGPERRGSATTCRASTTPTSSSTRGRLSPSSPVARPPAVGLADRGRPAAAPRRDQRARRSVSLRCRSRATSAWCSSASEPYGPSEVAANLGVDVLGVLADDPKGAAAIDGTGGVEALPGRARWCAAPAPWPASLAARLDADASADRGRTAARNEMPVEAVGMNTHHGRLRRDRRPGPHAGPAARTRTSVRPWRPTRSSGRRRSRSRLVARGCPPAGRARLAAGELDRLASDRLARGADLLLADDELALFGAVMASVRGPRADPALPRLDPTSPTSTSAAATRCGSSSTTASRVPGEPVADSDDELIELVRLGGDADGAQRAPVRCRQPRAEPAAARRQPAVRDDGGVGPAERRDPPAPVRALVARRARRRGAWSTTSWLRS